MEVFFLFIFFSPASVALVDFPEYVERMHKDSDLLFADAYKVGCWPEHFSFLVKNTLFVRL